MPASRAGAARYREPIKPAVADDMALILGGMTVAAEDGSPPRGQRATQVRSILDPARPQRRRIPLGLGAAMAVSISAAVVGALLFSGSLDLPSTKKNALTPNRTDITAAAPAVMLPSKEEAAPVAVTETASPQERPSADDPGPLQLRPQTQPQAKPATVIRESAVREREPPAPILPAPRQEGRANCDDLGEAEQAWCLAPAMLAADRELRAAYAAAIDAGVEPSIIADYRRRWSKLRRRSSDEPAFLIGSYGALAEDLHRLAHETREAGPGPW